MKKNYHCFIYVYMKWSYNYTVQEFANLNFVINLISHLPLCLFKLGRGSFGESAFTRIHCRSSQRWEFRVQSVPVITQKHVILCVQSRWCSLSSEVSNLDIFFFYTWVSSCHMIDFKITYFHVWGQLRI